MPQKDETKTFMVEDAQIKWRNFAGKEGMYNAKGERGFALILDDKTAEDMIKEGWTPKWPKPDEEGIVGEPFISVRVKFEVFPPRIVMMTTRARTTLTEDTVEVLDWANIDKVDLICRGYYWDVNGKQGWKPYVKSMFVTIDEDFLERKYAINEVED